MYNEWRVSANYVGGETYYQVYRLRRSNAVDHGGNREYYGDVTGSRAEAEALAEELNAKEA